MDDNLFLKDFANGGTWETKQSNLQWITNVKRTSNTLTSNLPCDLSNIHPRGVVLLGNEHPTCNSRNTDPRLQQTVSTLVSVQKDAQGEYTCKPAGFVWDKIMSENKATKLDFKDDETGETTTRYFFPVLRCNVRFDYNPPS